MSFFGKITTKEHYGVRLALRIAETYYTQKPASLKEISQEEKISMKYLEQLIVPFRKSGWVESIKGRSGGYIMKKNPDKISLKDVVLLLDEDLCIVDCLKGNAHKDCPHGNKCPSRSAWARVQNALDNEMEKIKFSSLIKV